MLSYLGMVSLYLFNIICNLSIFNEELRIMTLPSLLAIIIENAFRSKRFKKIPHE
jgi:hypothetical protein